MRRLDLTFSALLPPLDFFSLMLAAVTAYSLRFSKFFTDIRPILTDIPFTEYMASVSIFVLIWILLFALAGLYSIKQPSIWSMLGRIILGSTSGIMVVIAFVFFSREFTTSRFVVLAVWGLAMFYVLCGRLLLRMLRSALLGARIGHQSVAIVGNAKAAEDLAALYTAHPRLGLTLVKQAKSWSASLGKELEKLAQKGKLDILLLADPELEKKTALEMISFAEAHHIDFRYLADLFSATFTNVEMSTIGGIPVIDVKRTRLEGWGRIWKRIFDILGSLLLLTLVSPILLITALALMLEDGLPVLFKNERIGERGKSFRLLKLRSMWRKYSIGPQFKGLKKNLKFEEDLIKKQSIKEGPVYKIADDPRVTRIGKFIRRWSIDELPQFLNVLRGDMSLVGPRPHQPREVEKYLPHQRHVLAIKPGITGLAQISGRSDLEFEDEVRLDAWYIENWSPALDLYILLKTPFAVIRRKGAY